MIEPNDVLVEYDEDFDEDMEFAGELDDFDELESEYYTHLRELQVCINVQSCIGTYAHRLDLATVIIAQSQDVAAQSIGTVEFDHMKAKYLMFRELEVRMSTHSQAVVTKPSGKLAL